MYREYKNLFLFCYRDDKEKFKETIWSFILTIVAMLALTVILTVNFG